MDYELKRSRRRTAALEITKDCRVLVRAPLRMPRAEIDAFVAAHRDWLEGHLAAQRARMAAAPPPPAAPAPKAQEAKGTGGTVLLHDVPEREAAMVMAVVAHRLGRPLNQLRFKSIREVKEK